MLLDANNPLMNVSNIDLLDLLLACAMIFSSVYFSNKLLKRDIRKENKMELDKKADKERVEFLHEEHEKDISEIRNSIEKNSNQHGILFKEINAANKGIARIEGYLKAKEESK